MPARRWRRSLSRSARASRPISSTCVACARTAGASGAKFCPLPSPPRISTAFFDRPFSAATVAPTLVPLESSSQSTPPRSATRSMRCGRPRKLRRPCASAASGTPASSGERAGGERVGRVVRAGERQLGDGEDALLAAHQPCRRRRRSPPASSGASRPKVTCVRPGSASAIEAESPRLSTCAPSPGRCAPWPRRTRRAPRSGRDGPRTGSASPPRPARATRWSRAGSWRAPAPTRRAAFSRFSSASSAGGPMLPATSQSTPAARSRCPVSAVTVLLPLVPVTASTLPVLRATCQANSSMSPTTGMFFASAAWIELFLQRKARADADQVDVLQQRRLELAGVQFAGESPSSRGGAARVSATRTLPPSRSTQFATDSPVSPRPSTSTRLPLQRHRRGLLEQREGRFAHHRSFSVDRPNSTSIMVMIQKRTTTCDSFQPSSS